MLYEQIFRKLNDAGIRYLVVGGIAVNLHGFARATGDLDVLLALDQKNVDSFVAAVKTLSLQPRAPVSIDDFADGQNRRTWAEEKGMHAFTLLDPQRPMEQLDVVLSAEIDFEAAYGRRETVAAGDVSIPLIGIDDLMLLKSKAGRDRDLIDLKALETIKGMKR